MEAILIAVLLSFQRSHATNILWFAGDNNEYSEARIDLQLHKNLVLHVASENRLQSVPRCMKRLVTKNKLFTNLVLVQINFFVSCDINKPVLHLLNGSRNNFAFVHSNRAALQVVFYQFRFKKTLYSEF